jgi:ABC-type multidrug transport system ATPase subunit
MNASVDFRNVTKRFDGVVALDDVTVSIPQQSIVGLIGRNGSGKTTLLRHITGMMLSSIS